MKPLPLLLFLLVGWTAVGTAGVLLRLSRGERRIALRHLAWIAGVWAAYLSALLTVSLFQPQRVVARGKSQCFDEMCFTVLGADTLPGYLIRDGSHLLRVRVRITNQGHIHPESESQLREYLIDGQGRTYTEVRGLTGNPLTARVPPGSAVLSEPVFRVPGDATRLALVLTHGRRQPGTLTLGDPDSPLHRPTLMPLEP